VIENAIKGGGGREGRKNDFGRKSVVVDATLVVGLVVRGGAGRREKGSKGGR